MGSELRFLCFLLSLSLMGCGHINVPFLSESPDPSKVKEPGPKQVVQLSNEFVEKGNIANAQKLQEAKNIVIIPFTAGEGAESTDELDRVGLMIIKGVDDAFAEDKSGKHAHFNILTDKNSGDADLIIKGHITSMSGPSKIRRLMPLAKSRKLGVEGKITDIRSGETIAIFTDSAKIKLKDDDYKQLGYAIGKNIGRFILSGIK